MILPTRLRKNKAIRSLVRENRLDINDVIYPLFIVEGNNIKEEIPSMNGQYHLSLDMLNNEIKELNKLGINAVLLFGVPNHKDPEAQCDYDQNGIIQKAIKKIREIDPEMYIIGDVCLCEYKSDGHCCFFNEDGTINRKKTLDTLAKTALSYAEAGVDMVAPSDMMDEHTKYIREALDNSGYENIPIMSYSTKYSSSFYGPFRDAANSAPTFGNRRSYQMDPANSNEAIKESLLDTEEGADCLMVKPAMPYLDILTRVKEITYLPVAAYQVSGEYAMLKEAVNKGLLDEKAIYESLLSIKRAGADIIITYFAKELPELIKKYQET